MSYFDAVDASLVEGDFEMFVVFGEYGLSSKLSWSS